MKKLINDPARVVDELAQGLALADDRYALLPDETVLVRADHANLRAAGKVAILSGGGSGHEPAHAGYVGRGMLTGAIAGAVFTSPSVDAVLKAILTVGGPQGVLLIVKNYTGDRLNFGLAAEFARAQGVPVEIVVVGDDVALGAGPEGVGRRGIAGTILVHKIAGAAAEAGLPLGEVARQARAAADNLATMGVGLSACTVPAAGSPGFTLDDQEIEVGLGIHGEPGARRGPMAPADVLVDEILAQVTQFGQFSAGERVALLVNGLGGTPALELAIVARGALKWLSAKAIEVACVQVGTFMSALEMAGCSLSLLRLDAEREAHLLAPTTAPGWSEPTRPTTDPHRTATIALEQTALLGGPSWNEGPRMEAAIARAIAALRGAEDELTRLDAAVGDGDLGISMTRAAAAVEAALPSFDLAHPASALARLSAVLRRHLGGTSGPLYAMFALRAATSLAGESQADEAAWSRALAAGCQGIMDLGGAAPGDRTMLDALVPASEAFAATRGSGRDRLAAALDAARAGAEATKAMAPRRGRASYVGDRTLGHPDPGAVAVGVWLGAIAEPS